MIIKKSGGRWQLSLLASVVISAFFLNTAYAWQQEYIVDTQPGHSTERYTWDSDHQPDYNDILSQRIQSSQRALGLEVNLAEETPVDVTSSMSMGWNFPLYEQVTTGPVAALHYDGTTTSMYNEFGDSTTTLTDPLWHASVSSLGWRVDSRLGDLRPWAQISYNQQFGENIWKAQSGLSRMTATNQNGNWLDVTVGADMLLNQNIAAYAALHSFAAVVPVCAKSGRGVDELLAECAQLLHEGEWIFDGDMMTDQSARQMAAEIIREKILRTVDREVPHGIAVTIEDYTEEPQLTSIRAEIYCEKQSHKGILVGKNGETLKRIGSYAREDLERLLGTKVYLNLWVRVRENWRERAQDVRGFGYGEG